MLTTALAVNERLSLLCRLSESLEEIQRAAFRDVALGPRRYAHAGHIRGALLSRFDVRTAALPLSTADRIRARTALCAAAAAFARSLLARRLFAVPSSAVRAADTKYVDIVITDRRGRRYGVCFATVREPFGVLKLAQWSFRAIPGLAGIVVYDLERHASRYIRSATR